MVSINRIHIKNFRSIVDETIELSNYNFLVGKNDSGKSNVLKALNLFFNGMTDFNTPFDFASDYSLFAKRGSKQAKEIIISLEIVMPDSFKEKGAKLWTKTWRSEGLHDDNLDKLFKSGSKGLTLFKRIQYLYIPAVKSSEYFKFLLAEVYSSMNKMANGALKNINAQYSKKLQELTVGLSEQLRQVLKIKSSIQMPQNMNVLFRDLTFLTSDEYVKEIDLSHRGDGIRARHIPSILRYMQNNIEENRIKNAIGSSFIWGFEEPENGVEYLSCYEMADELYSYRDKCQIIVTTHSPAFYMKKECQDVKCFYVFKDGKGASKYQTNINLGEINEKIGFLPIIAPYIESEREKYLEQVKNLKDEITELQKKYSKVVNKVVIITEGKTDIKHIKFAFENLNLDNNVLNKIEYYDFQSKQVLGQNLENLLEQLSNLPNITRYVGIFDRDKKIFLPQENGYVKMKNNVYKFNIPYLENAERKKDDKICIEHYYSNDEIETVTDFGHLYMGKNFDMYGKSDDGHWVFQNFQKNESMNALSIIDSNCKHLQKIDSEANIISKDDFADYVINHPDEFDFHNFKKIYDILVEIIQDK